MSIKFSKELKKEIQEFYNKKFISTKKILKFIELKKQKEQNELFLNAMHKAG